MKYSWLLLLIPALIGLAFYAILGSGLLLPDPLLHIRMSFSYLCLFTGLLITIIMLVIWEFNRLRRWQYQFQRQVLAQAADNGRINLVQ